MMDTLNKIKWLGRFFKVIIERHIEWKIITMEEDGGAWDSQSHKRKTLELAVDAAWEQRRMDTKIKGVLAFRELNYHGLSDDELGIKPIDLKEGEK